MKKFLKTNWFIVTLVGLFLLIYLAGYIAEGTYAEEEKVLSNHETRENETEIIVQYKTANSVDRQIETISLEDEAVDEMVEAMQKQSDVVAVEEDFPIQIHGEPNDTYFHEQWYLDSIDAIEAWKTATVTEETVTVAVIDSGIDASHPDLQGKVLPGYNFINDNTDVTDVHGHGTAVAGLIAAVYGNGEGIAGTAGKANVEILPLKVANDKGVGKVSDMIEAVHYAIEQGVDVINISMGGVDYSQILKNAVDTAANEGILVIASAGNDGNTEYNYPASYDSVLSIGSVSASNQSSDFSNYNDQVDLVAPGEKMISTGTGNTYNYYYGTSFSSAVVSGMAAFMLAVEPTLDIQTINHRLEGTAIDLGVKGKDDKYGYGLVNLADALVEEETTVSITDILFEEDAITLSVGETIQPALQIMPENAVESLIWETGDEEVARVNDEGVISGTAPGEAIITVRTLDGRVSASIQIMVEESFIIPERYKELESLQINGNDFYLQVTFSTGVDPESVHEDTIYILDETDNNIDVEYGFEANNEKVNVITEANSYEKGKPYYLFVDEGVKTEAGKELNQPIVVEFMWTEDEGVLTQQVIQ